MTITATTAGVCECCEVCAPTGYDCRTRGGTAVLCGFSEYTLPSTPPKKYRVETVTLVEVVICPNDGGSGTRAPRTQIDTYNSLTCAVSRTGDFIGTCTSMASDTLTGLTPTTNTRVLSTNGNVQAPGRHYCGCFDYEINVVATRTATLSVEDTEANALTRLFAGAAGTWSAWTATGSGSGGTCLPGTCCLARWELRGAGDFSITYQEAEWRVVRTGLTPSTSYSIKVELWRRVFGVGSYVYYGHQYFTASSDGAGNLSTTGAVANDRGFETYVKGIELCT